jgi:hypothetical protein
MKRKASTLKPFIDDEDPAKMIYKENKNDDKMEDNVEK